MNPDIKKKWIEALRSGNYKQGRQQLRRASDNSFCCLGVLCDILDPEAWKEYDPTGRPACHPLQGPGYTWGNQFGNLPTLTAADLSISMDDAGKLIKYNDDGASFEDLARIIESEL